MREKGRERALSQVRGSHVEPTKARQRTGTIKIKITAYLKKLRSQFHHRPTKYSNIMSNGNGEIRVGTDTVKMGLAQMLKGGVIVSSLTKGRYHG